MSERRGVICAGSFDIGMSVVQEGIFDVDPVERCYLGWRESLGAVAQLVEPDIPG